MGSGKSTVGRLLAERLKRPFIDIDERVEKRAGCSVAELFARAGEEAFRRLEAEALAEALAEKAAVIATGGGALLDEDSREQARRRGAVAVLLVDPAQVLQRVGREGAADRPLLDRDPERLRRRLADRAAKYARAAHIAVDTTRLTPVQVADRVIAKLERLAQGEPRLVPIRSGAGRYEVWVGFGLLEEAGLRAAAAVSGRRALIVSDEQVGPLYLDLVAQSFRTVGFTVARLEVPAGEAIKALPWVERIYDAALDAELDRRSLMVALGGGVIGDLVGFAAATYMRGIPVVQIPTSLLAQIDASVGGKTGVNHARGKNLIGAFHPPALVLCDLDVLTTLPEREWRAGLAEAVKHGVLADAGYFEWIERQAAALTARREDVRLPLVLRSIEIKAAVVEEDEREADRRAVLNLGHTIGHAIETCLGYRHWLHGEAVAVGLVAVSRLACRLGLLAQGDADRIEAVLRNLGLPTRLPPGLAPERVLAATRTDKKRIDGHVRWVLPVKIGRVILSRDVPPEAVSEVLAGLVP